MSSGPPPVPGQAIVYPVQISHALHVAIAELEAHSRTANFDKVIQIALRKGLRQMGYDFGDRPTVLMTPRGKGYAAQA